jgi:hypothetical protein
VSLKDRTVLACTARLCDAAAGPLSGPVSLQCTLLCCCDCASPPGTPWGQAAVIRQYQLEDGTLITPQGEQPQPSSVELPPSLEEVQAAQAAVQEQGAAVRALKEGQGLTNADPAVQAAVTELQQRKEAAEQMQQRYQLALREAAALDESSDE